MNTKEKTEKKEEKLTELLSQAESHPIMQKIKAEKSAAILATRLEAAGKIEGLRKEQAKAIPKLQNELKVKESTYLTAKARLQTVQDEFQAAKAVLASEVHRITHAISQQEGILFETSDPLLDDATTFFREKLAWLRSPGRISSNRLGGERNLFTEKVTLKAESNVDAINSALRFCMDAIKELEKMKLTPELDKVKIERLKDELPRIDIYRESTGEKPFPKPPPTFQQTHGHVLAKIDALKKKVGIPL